MDELIKRLSEIRCIYNCLDEYDEPYYRALSEAIQFISEHTEKRTDKHTKTHASDLISRQAAIEAFGDKPLAWTEGEYELGLQNQWQSDIDALKALPPAQPTLYGYSIESLAFIAALLAKENFPPERVSEALSDIGRVVAIVKEEYEEALREAVTQCMI